MTIQDRNPLATLRWEPNRALSHQDGTPLPQDQVQLSYQDWRELDGPMTKALAATSSSIVGAGNGLGNAITCACAGGAHGAVHGAGLDPMWNTGLLAVNLAAVGIGTANYAAIQPSEAGLGPAVSMGLWGAAAAVRVGVVNWNRVPSHTKEAIYQAAEQATDKLLPAKEEPTLGDRVARGAVGELAGAAAGGAVGFQHGFGLGQLLGQRWFDGAQETIYNNMHQPSPLQALAQQAEKA